MAPPSKPLIAVIGATGTGKSNLAVDLALRHNGEIINGDAMQLYAGLPIITNKHPLAERHGVPHHLLGDLDPAQPPWTVADFVRAARRTVADIHARGRVPILVGGTHYYAQALLWEDATLQGGDPNEAPEPAEEAGHEGGEGENTGTMREEMDEEAAREARFPILGQATDVVLARLREVDPVMAERWHPHDRRKIQRSLEIWLRTGRRASDVYQEQEEARQRLMNAPQQPQPGQNGEGNGDGASAGGGGLRYPSLIFWVHADKPVLRARLDRRVDGMIAQGLLDEISTLDACLRAQAARGTPVDRSKGIWVSIGFKEFAQYKAALDAGSTTPAALAALRTEAVARTQAATRAYAKRQVRWIRIKLLAALARARATDRLYLLDGTDLARWDAAVAAPARDLAARFLAGDDADAPLPPPSSLSPAARDLLVPPKDDHSSRRDQWVQRTCDVCNTTAVTPPEWQAHVSSRRHKKTVAARRRKSLQLRPDRTPAIREKPALDAAEILESTHT